MGSFYDVLFEVSNEDRHRILLKLVDNARNVTQLSKMLDLSLTETSRHLSRILEVGLTQRDADGLYHINNFGRVLLAQLNGVEFVTRHKDYFTSHAFTDIPQEFVARIGELSDSYFVDNVMTSFHNIERLLMEADEYILEMTDRYIMSTYPLLRDAFNRDVKLKNIQRTEFLHQKMYSDIDPKLKEELDDLFPRFWEERFLSELPFFLYMSEKEVACIGFQTIDGNLDYIGFSSKSKKVHKWCHDLFKNYWERAKLKHEIN